MQRSILIAVCVAMHSACFSQNLISSQSWTVGSGSVGVFSENGVDSQNVRELGTNPFGAQAILWKAVVDAANGPDGGWDTNNFPIDNTKMYRFAVWLKKSNSTDGYTYFGCGSNDILSLAGSVDSNPYFWLGDLPTLDRWYLLVGYVHASSDPSTTSYGGIYDGVTGAKVAGTTDFKFSSTATTAKHRSYLYYDLTTSDRQYFYGPEVYKVDQPVTETFLPNMTGGNVFFGGKVGIGTMSPSFPLHVVSPAGDAGLRIGAAGLSTEIALHVSASNFGYLYLGGNTNIRGNGAQSTFDGFVGIGTTNPDYPLTVNGSIHAKEVRVDLNVPGPDYVFEKDYKLASLEDIKNYIDQNKHLPEVPSAKEMEKDGVQLGEMNMILLKKIEELTLYVIDQDKKMEEMRRENEKEINALKKLIKQ